jgi:acetyl esterase/lipase
MVVMASVLAACLSISARAADPPAASEPVVIDVWPGPAPGDSGGATIGEETTKTDPRTKAVTSLTNVSKPTLKVFRPALGTANGAAVIVAPGGGYTNLAWDHEGEQVARWLNSIGVTAFVLKYRVPRRPGQPRDQPPPQPLMDAQRSLSLVRAKAADYAVDPDRIGMLGFSAGGHLTAAAATNFDHRTYETVDASDRASCRPDFAVMIYPGGVLKRGTPDIEPGIKVTDKTPPSFLVHANDDPGNPVNSVALYLALKKAGVPAELHIYNSGGHGFGMRKSSHPSSEWSKRCEEWLRDRGLLKPKSSFNNSIGTLR